MKQTPKPLDRRQFLMAGTMVASATGAAGAATPATDPGGDTLELWPAGAPGAGFVTVREEIIERLPEGPLRDRFVQHTTKPLLTLFKPKGTWNGVTLLIVPGGGYVRVVIDKEGFEAANWYAERGFAAAVLRYRMPADGWAAGADAPVHDALRALRILRQGQLPSGTATRRIGIVGFSAGGHLCARALTKPGLSYPRQDAADDLPARPDFAVLMYPVIATTGAAAHAGSADQIRKAGVAASELIHYSPHLDVTAQTPPTMLVHAADDTTVPVENSLLMYRALLDAGVRSELHVFDSGGHGFGLRAVTGKNVAIWPTLVQNWALGDDGR